ncbi:MAG: sugar ABC transporter permease [Opitutia bacterium]|nr:ABC transporter permease [Opitutaceae bacterium]PHX84905.1 MAG: sugar ABC transporter permease [Opitutae bacterium]
MSAPGTLPRWAELGLLPVINLVAALLISGVVIMLLGESPVAAFKLMAAGSVGTQEGIGYTLYYATNFIFTGLAVAVAYHAGLFNIGAEGQAYIGGLGTALVCLWLGAWPFWAVLPLAVLAGAGFGAVWAFIPAYLQAKRGSHIVITTIMFNFIAASLMTYLLVNVLIKPGQQSPESREFSVNAWMPSATDVLARVGVGFAATPLNLAFGFALGAAVLVWLLVWRTRWGYALRVAGENPAAAVFAGIAPPRVIIGAMLLSGALAGGLGLNELMGSQHRILMDFPSGAGFVGIAVALMGRNHPAGIIVAAVLFGALYQGGSQLSFDMPKINRDMVVVIQGLVILLCGAMENVFKAPLAKLWHGCLARDPKPTGGTPAPR